MKREMVNAFMLWNQVMEKKSKHEAIAEPVMPWKRKVPSRYGYNGNEYFHSNPKLFYRQHYFDVVDYVAGNIKERFDQPDYSIYIKLQNIILKASCCQVFRPELNSLEDLYKDDFNFFALKSQLELPPKFVTGKLELSEIISSMKNLSTEKRFLFSKVIKLIKIILIAPAINAISERSFSTLKRVKTSIRSTMTDSRLNHLLLIHIYKEELDEIDIKLITNEFIKIKESRIATFGLYQF